MKQGRSLSEIAVEIERQSKLKQDYVADTRKLSMFNDESGMHLALDNGSRAVMSVGDTAHRQIGERVGIPAKYYDRMLKDAPALLAGNVNHWFQTAPETRLVRTLDGRARAFLSNKYQRIDNIHLAQTIFPVVLGIPDLVFRSGEVTDRKLYLKFSVTRISAEIKSRRLGDMVEAGVEICNSEIGQGAVSVMPYFYFLACLNGMTRKQDGVRSAHIGTAYGAEGVAEVLADDTKQTLDRGILLQARDVVHAALDEAKFNANIGRMQEMVGEKIEGDPIAAIELLSNDFGFAEGEKSLVLRHLIEGGDLSRYGVMNAVTRTAQDLDSYDRASEFEGFGGRVFDLEAAQWRRVAQAA